MENKSERKNNPAICVMAISDDGAPNVPKEIAQEMLTKISKLFASMGFPVGFTMIGSPLVMSENFAATVKKTCDRNNDKAMENGVNQEIISGSDQEGMPSESKISVEDVTKGIKF